MKLAYNLDMNLIANQSNEIVTVGKYHYFNRHYKDLTAKLSTMNDTIDFWLPFVLGSEKMTYQKVFGQIRNRCKTVETIHHRGDRVPEYAFRKWFVALLSVIQSSNFEVQGCRRYIWSIEIIVVKGDKQKNYNSNPVIF